LELNGQPPPAPAHPNPPVGQAEDPQGGVGREVEATGVLKVESCFSSFLEPQFGQAGLREPVTRISEISLHWRQIYSKIGMGFGPVMRQRCVESVRCSFSFSN